MKPPRSQPGSTAELLQLKVLLLSFAAALGAPPGALRLGARCPQHPPAPLGAAQPLGRCCCPLRAGHPLLPPKSPPASAPKMLKWSQRAQSDPNQLGNWGWVPHSTPVHPSAFPSSSQPGALLPSSRSLLSQIRHQNQDLLQTQAGPGLRGAGSSGGQRKGEGMRMGTGTGTCVSPRHSVWVVLVPSGALGGSGCCSSWS